jgi:hypothetical protein
VLKGDLDPLHFRKRSKRMLASYIDRRAIESISLYFSRDCNIHLSTSVIANGDRGREYFRTAVPSAVIHCKSVSGCV